MEDQLTIAASTGDQPAPTPQPPGAPHSSTPASTTTPVSRFETPTRDQEVVAETLNWIAAELGTLRTRFVRLLPNGIWIVQTVVQNNLVSQPADRAEIAMAWSIGLSRDIYSATRPRVMTPNGEGIRPIAVTTYIAIPVLCLQQLTGVIEAAAVVNPRAEQIIRAAEGRIAEFATRLAFDPALRPTPHISSNTTCYISAGLSSEDRLQLFVEDWEFVEALRVPRTIREIVDDIGWSEDRAISAAKDLVARGIITVRSPTGVLTTGAPSPSGKPSRLLDIA